MRNFDYQIIAMLNRSVLAIFGLLSICWIGYVAVHLVSSTVSPSPSHVFTTKDTLIVVVHNPTEIDYTHPSAACLQKIPFYQQILSQQERIQHFYFSTTRNLAVLERSKPWTLAKIEHYFSKFGIGVNLKDAKNFTLSNGWIGKYSDHFLIVSDADWETIDESPINWKYIDRKSTVSFIHFAKSDFTIENSYSISSSKIKYISQSSNKGLPLANDQELFQENIPANFTSYEFYEKNYLKQLNRQQNPFFQWMQYGLAIVTIGDEKCIITDFQPGQDPIAILSSFVTEDSGYATEKKAEITNCNVPLNAISSTKWEIEVFNNLAFIAEKRSTIDHFIGDYQTGNTLAQSSIKKTKLFANTPKKVSYRKLTEQVHITKSCLPQSIHTVIENLNPSDAVKENVSNQLPPIRLQAAVNYFIPVQKSPNLYVVTEDNSLSLVHNQSLMWTKSLDGTLIGEPQLVPGTNQLVVTTSNGIFIYTLSGELMNSESIHLSNVYCNAVLYSWKGQTEMAIVAGNQLQTYRLNGKLQSSTKMTVTGNASISLAIQGVKGELIAHFIQNGIWYRYNIQRKRKINHITIGKGNWFFVKVNNAMGAIGITGKQLVRVGENGKKSILIGRATDLVKHLNTKDEPLFFVYEQQRIYVLTATGQITTQFDTRVTRIEDAYLATLGDGKTLVGILDGISNNSYIYTLKGNELGKQQFEGSNKLVFHQQSDGVLLLVSQSNSYLIRYTLNY
jgi:hypothetical protein